MSVPRVRKAKHNRPDMGAVIENANQLNFAIMVRTLYMVYDFDKAKLDEFCESYIALLEEIADHRATVTEFVKDTKQLCGIDVAKLVKELNVTNRKER
jgi:hypothetical protein